MQNVSQFLLLTILIPLCYCNEEDGLPDTLTPTKYDLEIVTFLEDSNFSFEGKVFITMSCAKETNTITLHSKDLKIVDDVHLIQIISDTKTADVPIKSYLYRKGSDFFDITVNQPLVPGNVYRLFIAYTGELKEDNSGYCRKQYVDPAGGSAMWYTITQFEPASARKAFPCLDSPKYKATFVISLMHRNNLKAVSNMPIKTSVPLESKPDWVMDTFHESIPIPPHAVAFMLSDFEYLSSEVKDSNVIFGVWARKEVIDQVKLAVEIGPAMLSFFSEFFKINYPLAKMDFVAIPDFASDPIGNLGLIYIGETQLTFKPTESTLNHKMNTASAISQGLVEQWFGNMVTMYSWSDIWLYAAFIEYFARYGVNHVFPEWKILDDKGMADFVNTLWIDSWNSGHSVMVPIKDPNEVQSFDSISFIKGSLIMRMMDMNFGDVFKKSVQNFLKQNLNSNANQENLWNELTKVARENNDKQLQQVDLKKVMDDWIVKLAGYPLVTVTADYLKNTVSLTQEWYSSGAGILPTNESNDSKKSECWVLPLTYTTSKEMNFDNTKVQNWLTCDGPLTLPLDLKNSWFIFNIKISSLYRVQYDEKNWALLETTLADKNTYNNIDKMNRAQILIDTFGLAWIGKMNYETVFRIVQYLQHETELWPLTEGFQCLMDIGQKMQRTDVYDGFKNFFKKLMTPIFTNFGKITELSDDPVVLETKTAVVRWACTLGVTDCIKQTITLFENWKKESQPDKNNPISLELRSAVCCSAIEAGGEEAWNFLWERYKNLKVENGKKTILQSLTCSKDKVLLQRYLLWSIDSTKVEKEDSLFVFRQMVEKDVGFLEAKDFIMKKFMDIYKYHDSDSSIMGLYLVALVKKMNSREELNEFQSFTSSMKDYLKDAETLIKGGIEFAKLSVAWREKYLETMKVYFSKV